MNTTSEYIPFNYSDADKALFQNGQDKHWETIEAYYVKLRALCRDELKIQTEGTHKAWVTQRVEMHMVTSIIRLLYLTESFKDACLSFNAPAAAIHVKAMAEVPLHLGYLLSILTRHTKFSEIQDELKKLAWGIKDENSGLTTKASITQKALYERADEMAEEIFKSDPSEIKIFKTIYKEANATGHHNYEGRNVLIGVQNDDTWRIKDRKEWFVFISSNIFQFFLSSSAILSFSFIFCDAIEHYLAKLPEELS